MKYLLTCVLVLVMVAGISFAEGRQEEEKPIELTWMLTGDAKMTEGNGLLQYAPEGYDNAVGGVRTWQTNKFMAENPGIKLEMVLRDVSQGSMTLDSMLAAGNPPDVIHDSARLTWKYLNADYALPLDEYMDIDRFQENLVEKYSREGHCYALVHNNITIGLSINLDMLKNIGMILPPIPEWDTNAYDAIAAKLKSALNIPATVVIANKGIGMWEQMWLHNAGGKLFTGGDRSKVTINDPNYIWSLNYWKSLADKGYSFGIPIENIDDTGIDNFAAGKIFSCTEQTGHVAGWMPRMIENGLLEKPFEYTFTEVPHRPDVDSAPVSNYQGTIVAHKSDDEARNLAAVKLVEFIFRHDNTQLDVIMGTTPSLKEEFQAIGRAASDPVQAMWKLAQNSGSIDYGDSIPNISEVTRGWVPMLHSWFREEINTEQLIAQMEEFANDKLAEN